MPQVRGATKGLPMKKFLLPVLLLSVALSGCMMQESLSGDAYSRSGARSGNIVRIATILSIDEVLIEGDGGMAGSVGGAILGTAIGSAFGGGSGHAIGAAAGGVGGAIAGSALEHKITQRKGLEITVQYAGSGECEAIVQEPGKDALYVGQQVRVLTDEHSGTKRVRPLSGAMAAQPQ
jgi:outer membrane lipoprotein SlyB